VSTGALPGPVTLACPGTTSICAGDFDFYGVVVPAGMELAFSIKGFSKNLDVELYGPFGPDETVGIVKRVDEAATSSSVETVNAYTRDGGRFLARVKGKNGDEETPYELDLVVKASACVEDAYDAPESDGEPLPQFDLPGTNDTPETASGLGVSLAVATETELGVCPSDVDWFVLGEESDDPLATEVLPLAPWSRLTVSLVSVTGTSASNLLLFVGPDPVALAAAASAQTTKQQTVTVDTTGELLYAVVVAADAAGEVAATYRLRTTVVSPPTCGLDGLGDRSPTERNDTPADAYVLSYPPWPATAEDPAFTFPKGASDVLTLCATDLDWYRINLPPDTALKVSLGFDFHEAEAGLALFDHRVANVAELKPGEAPSEGRLGLSEKTGTGAQSLSGTPSLGVAYILVFNKSQWPLSRYTLTIELSGGSCQVDRFEPNNTAGAATPLNVVPSATLAGMEEASLEDLTVCGDHDFFALTLGPQDSVNADVHYDPAEGDLDLALVRQNSASTTLASATDSGKTGLLSVTYTVAESALPQAYNVKVVSAGALAHKNRYQLDVRVQRSCVDDRYTPATLSSPFPVFPAVAPLADGNMQLCNAEDWYAVNVPDGGDVSVCIRFRHVDIDLDLSLYTTLGNPEQTPVWLSSASKNDWESVTFSAEPGVTYWARVFPDFRSPGTTRYSMWIVPGSGGCPAPCENLVADGDETDIDCGGSCASCAVGFGCRAGNDCRSGACKAGTCACVVDADCPAGTCHGGVCL
jgi:hypothetical protein